MADLDTLVEILPIGRLGSVYIPLAGAGGAHLPAGRRCEKLEVRRTPSLSAPSQRANVPRQRPQGECKQALGPASWIRFMIWDAEDPCPGRKASVGGI